MYVVHDHAKYIRRDGGENSEKMCSTVIRHRRVLTLSAIEMNIHMHKTFTKQEGLKKFLAAPKLVSSFTAGS